MRCVVTLEVKVAAVVDCEVVVIASVVVEGAEIEIAMHVKNSTSLTANWKVLLNLYISTFLVLKLTLMLTFLRPAGSPPGRTAVTSTRE